MKLSPELQAMVAADDAAVSDRNAARNQTLGMATLLLGGVIAAYFALTTSTQKPENNVQSDEEFQTTTFQPPSFLRETEKPNPEPPNRSSICRLPHRRSNRHLKRRHSTFLHRPM